jgi:hypothetical protein
MKICSQVHASHNDVESLSTSCTVNLSKRPSGGNPKMRNCSRSSEQFSRKGSILPHNAYVVAVAVNNALPIWAPLGIVVCEHFSNSPGATPTHVIPALMCTLLSLL